MKLPVVVTVLIVSSISVWGSARADDNLYGRWKDNAPQFDPIGTLDISKGAITLGHKVKYQVQSLGAFGEGGELFAVTGMNRKIDPEGCGRDGKVHYLAVQPLPDMGPDLGGPGIRVFFDSGDTPPTVDSIQKEIAVCSVRPFSR